MCQMYVYLLRKKARISVQRSILTSIPRGGEAFAAFLGHRQRKLSEDPDT